jgi:hypothetical protein
MTDETEPCLDVPSATPESGATVVTEPCLDGDSHILGPTDPTLVLLRHDTSSVGAKQ